MGLAEGLLIVAIICVFGFLVLRPDRFGRTTRGDAGGDSGTGGFYSSDGDRIHDLTGDHGGGDGGSDGGDGGGGD
jgi:hypothetical protein